MDPLPRKKNRSLDLPYVCSKHLTLIYDKTKNVLSRKAKSNYNQGQIFKKVISNYFLLKSTADFLKLAYHTHILPLQQQSPKSKKN
jgi:hypothetical protein